MPSNVVQLSEADSVRNKLFGQAILTALRNGHGPEDAANAAWEIAWREESKRSHLAALELGAAPSMIYLKFSDRVARNQKEAKEQILRQISSEWELHWNGSTKRWPGAPDGTLRRLDGTASIEVEIKAHGDVVSPHQLAFGISRTWVSPRIFWIFPAGLDRNDPGNKLAHNGYTPDFTKQSSTPPQIVLEK